MYRRRLPQTFSKFDDAPLFYKRRQTARKLNVSVATVIRLERAGVIEVHKLKPGGIALHRAAQVLALAQVEEEG